MEAYLRGIKEVKCEQNRNIKEPSMLGSFTVSHRHANKKYSKKMTLAEDVITLKTKQIIPHSNYCLTSTLRKIYFIIPSIHYFPVLDESFLFIMLCHCQQIHERKKFKFKI